MQGKAEELFKTFSAKVDGVMADLKAKNPELFNGDTTKLQVSIQYNPDLIQFNLAYLSAQVNCLHYQMNNI